MTIKHITLQQGSDFELVARWESKTLAFRSITAITKAAPPLVTALAHGLPDGWRAAFTNIKGMTALNALNDPVLDADYRTITVPALSVDTFSVNEVDATGFGTYTSGGIVRYWIPTDLSGWTARMQIRATLASAAFLIELTSGNTRIVVDNVKKTITATLLAADTTALNFSSGVYSLEMVNGVDVIQLLVGKVKFIKEITR